MLSLLLFVWVLLFDVKEEELYDRSLFTLAGLFGMVINVVRVGVVVVVVVVVPSVVCARGRDNLCVGVATVGVLVRRRGSLFAAAGEARTTTEGEE